MERWTVFATGNLTLQKNRRRVQRNDDWWDRKATERMMIRHISMSMWILIGIFSMMVVGCRPEERAPVAPHSRAIIMVPDDVQTLTEALECVTPGGEIHVHEGRYHESVRITEDIRIVGIGASGAITIVSDNAPPLIVDTAMVTLENITMEYIGSGTGMEGDGIPQFDAHNGGVKMELWKPEKNTEKTEDAAEDSAPLGDIGEQNDQSKHHGADERSAAVVVHHGTLSMESCRVTSEWADGIIIDPWTQLELKHCRIEQTAQIGIRIGEGATLRMENGLLAGNRVGICADAAAEVSLRKMTIEQSGRIGLLLHRSPATLDHCTLRNLAVGMELGGEGEVRVTDGRLTGCSQGIVIRGGPVWLEKVLFSGGSTGVVAEGTFPKVLRECTFSGVRSALRDSGTGMVVEEGTFDGAGGTAGGGLVGIWLEKEASPVIHGCVIRNFGNTAVQCMEKSAGQFEDCRLECSEDGVRCVTVSSECAPQFLRTTMRGGMAEVVLTAARSGMVLEECDISGSDVGLRVDQAGNPLLRGKCRISGNKRTGILIDPKGGGTFEDCEIEDNGLHAVVLTGTGEVVLRRCGLRSGSASAVLIEQKCGEVLMEECRLTGASSGHGIQVRRGGNLTMRGGVIQQREASGILLSEQSRGLLEGCEISDCAIGIQTNRSAPDCRSVVIRDVGTGAKFLAKSEVLLQDCQIERAAKMGVEVADSTVAFLKLNVLKCGETGVFLTDSTSGQMTGGTVSENGGDGISLQNRSRFQLTRCVISGNRGVGLLSTEGCTLEWDGLTTMEMNSGGNLSVPDSTGKTG